MTEGFIYYNQGTRVLVRMAVSIFSLRNQGWTGGVQLIHQGPLPEWMQRFCETYDVIMTPVPPYQHVDYPLVQKASLWRWSWFDKNVFIDADTLFVNDPSSIFDHLDDDNHFFTTKFTDWKAGGNRIAGRVELWRNVPDCAGLVKDTLANGKLPAVNTGVVGWIKDKVLPPRWEAVTQAGWQAITDGIDPCPMDRTIDEIACQLLYGYDPTFKLLDDKWNRSITHGIASRDETVIVHFHGGKHLLNRGPGDDDIKWFCDQWRQTYKQLAKIEPGVRDAQGDKNLEHQKPFLLAGIANDARPDLTVVCAADEKYAGKLLKHMKLWMQMPGLKEQNFLVMCINSRPTRGEFKQFNQWPNVRLVAYENKVAPTPRERAFSAFVFGVSRHVTTPYHMKLDGDSVPKDGETFQWPDYQKHVITADPWHYTKVKGDPDAKQHWLTTLDQWWADQPDIPEENKLPLFDGIDPSERRVSHDRIRSYCFIADTEFIADLAKRCGDRLPVPSHDTTVWYVATQMGLSVNRYKFRKFINA